MHKKSIIYYLIYYIIYGDNPMEIISTYEETLYCANLLGKAVAFIDWQCNVTTIKLPEETLFDTTERKIREIQKLINVEPFRNGA